MTKTVIRILSFVLLVTTFAQAGPQVVQVGLVHTDDTAGYLAWLEEAAPTILAANDTTGALGACAPSFGAKQQGDVYFWTTTPSNEAMLSIDLNAPAVAREIAKVAAIRTVVSRDLWDTLKPGNLALEAGATYSSLWLIVETDQVSRYVALTTELEEALHQNGFEDLNSSAFSVTTGEFTGHVSVLVSAPTADRVGAMMDATGAKPEPWAAELRSEFDAGIRTIVQEMVLDCHVFAVRQ